MTVRPALHQPFFASRPRAFATVLTLWTLGMVALVLAVLQSAAFKQASGGRESLGRIRAYWAARAGVETQIATLTMSTLSPDTTSGYAVTAELLNTASADLGSAQFDIRHFDGIQTVAGPLDAHSRLNIASMSAEDLMLLDGMDETVAQNIVNWCSGVDAANPQGADESAYTGLRYPYKPRGNAPRSLRELELVQNLDPALLRGEDANFNNRLDPAEDDADASLPPDNANAVLDPGWSTFLTAVSESEADGLSASGQKRLDLRTASVEDIASRLRVERNQAQAVSDHAVNNTTTVKLEDYLRSDLATLAAAQAPGGTGARFLAPQANNAVQELADEQLKALLDECTVNESRRDGPRRGRTNLNTARRETLEKLVDLEPAMLDAILLERDGRAGGFTSMTELLAIDGIDRSMLAELMARLDVRSQVFVVTSRGKDRATGLEVEIVATIDRSSIPVVIKDLFVR